MSNYTVDEAVAKTQSKEGQELQQQYLKAGTPELSKMQDTVYKAYKRPYRGDSGTYVLIILANGWYYPTPEVKLYFEYDPSSKTYKLMQNNSNVGYYLITYHNAQWTSGLGLLNTPSSVVIEDANGKHTVTVESL
ncbi:MAG: hypothetical protein AAF901_10815 [Bacteroidota bacterium]